MAGTPRTADRAAEGVASIAPRGDLDLETVDDFDAEARRLLDDGAHTVVVDLRDVTFIDSAGLCRLAALSRRGRRTGHRVCFVRGSRRVTRLFVLTGLSAGMEWVRSPEDVAPALAGL